MPFSNQFNVSLTFSKCAHILLEHFSGDFVVVEKPRSYLAPDFGEVLGKLQQLFLKTKVVKWVDIGELFPKFP